MPGSRARRALGILSRIATDTPAEPLIGIPTPTPTFRPADQSLPPIPNSVTDQGPILASTYESRAAAVAALLAALGIDGSFDFGSARDACWMILAVDDLLCGADMAHEGFSFGEIYGLSYGKDTFITREELVGLIAQSAEPPLGPTGWDASTIQRVFLIGDWLVVEAFVRHEEERGELECH